MLRRVRFGVKHNVVPRCRGVSTSSCCRIGEGMFRPISILFEKERHGAFTKEGESAAADGQACGPKQDRDSERPSSSSSSSQSPPNWFNVIKELLPVPMGLFIGYNLDICSRVEGVSMVRTLEPDEYILHIPWLAYVVYHRVAFGIADFFSSSATTTMEHTFCEMLRMSLEGRIVLAKVTPSMSVCKRVVHTCKQKSHPSEEDCPSIVSPERWNLQKFEERCWENSDHQKMSEEEGSSVHVHPSTNDDGEGARSIAPPVALNDCSKGEMSEEGNEELLEVLLSGSLRNEIRSSATCEESPSLQHIGGTPDGERVARNSSLSIESGSSAPSPGASHQDAAIGADDGDIEDKFDPEELVGPNWDPSVSMSEVGARGYNRDNLWDMCREDVLDRLEQKSSVMMVEDSREVIVEGSMKGYSEQMSKKVYDFTLWQLGLVSEKDEGGGWWMWLEGDNARSSFDSRNTGAVASDCLRAIPVAVVYPFSTARRLVS